MRKKLLLFLENAYIDGELFAKKGEVKEVPVEGGSADRWLKRCAIEAEKEVEEKPIEEKPVSKKKKSKKKKKVKESEEIKEDAPVEDAF